MAKKDIVRYKEPMFDTTGANCLTTDPDVFMPEGKDHIKITRQAKALCAECPLVLTCLDYAIKNKEWGIWGGTTMKERKHLERFPTRKEEYIRTLIRTKGERDLVTLVDENTILED
jgi:WhiB family redox-sensing transcriptional regulator